jgi:hypothetical protein
MHQGRTFRPTVRDAALEDRTVLNGSGGFGGLGTLIGLGPTTATKAVQQAFRTFDQSYANDVFTILYGSGGPSATTRTAFDTQVGKDLQTLQTAVDSAISGLATASTLTATVNGELTGSASTTLQSELAAIPTPSAPTGFFRFFFGGPFRFLGTSNSDIGQTAQQVEQQVQTASTPANAISVATVQSLLQTVNTAFATFVTSYNTDVANNLTGSSPSQTNFNAAVAKDLGTLNSTITAAVSSTTALAPIASTLTTTITNDLLTPSTGATGASLQERLAALPVPTGGNFFAQFWFRLGSRFTIGAGQAKVTSDIISAVKTYNTSLT